MDILLHYAWLIPLFPLLAFIVIVSFGRQLKEGASLVGIVLTAVSFGIAALTFWERF
ncbi:MAG: NADH-quinone oxidoreductase subunit, partial [Brevibacillus sp.]|nr:NADH-quinone oxidoreductase subunit [Brevibacillus sp.]